ncbi:MAG TPA: hypothetical protein VM840_04995 [Actinomycetota bacterium]|nr:hypothetical protein [Actinomycetota bacterium]
MARKRQWFLLGALGAVAGVLLKLVRGRREEAVEVGRWEQIAPAPTEEQHSGT